MSPISAFDIVSFLSILVAFCFLLIGWKRTLNRDAKLLFAGFLLLLLFYSIGNVLEWTGISNVLGLYEEYAAILVPVLLVFFFYTFLQKESQQTLSTSEIQYRSTINSMGDAIHVVDADLKIVLMNDRFEQWIEELNLEIGNPVDKKLSDIFPFLPDRVWDEYHQVFNEGKILSTEETNEITGKEFITETRKIPILEAGQVVRVVTVVRDITERKQAEQALLESQERYKSLFEGAPDAVYLHDLEGNIIDGNKAAEDMTGYSRGELIGKNLIESGLLLPEQVSKVEARLKKQALGESIGPDEFTLKRKDGSYVTVEVRTFPVRIADKMLTLGIARDISERKKAEEALRISEEKFRSFTEASPAGVFATDVEGNPIFWNERLCDITGMSFSEAKGQGWAQGVHPEDRDWVFSEWTKTVKKKMNLQVEHRFLHSDDTVTWGFVQALPVKNPQGRVTGYIGTITDITERKQAEQVRLVHLRFLESLDQVDRAIRGVSDLDQMMNNVLEAVLSIFNCDRAWLLHPCDPDAPSWRVPMECTVPEYPGALAMGIEVPMDQGVAEVLRTVLESDGPVKFGSGSEYPLPVKVAKQFGYQSQISMAVRPKVGQPWMFGLHQCSHPRIWTEEEEKLLQEIGRRIADAVSSMLTLRNLRESQERYRALVDNTDFGIALINKDFEVLMSNPAQGRMMQKDHRDFIGCKCHFEFERRNEICPHCPGILAMESGYTHEVETEGIRIDGTKISVRVQASPVYGGQGGIVGFVEIVEDITDRKQAEEALRESEEKFRSLAEQSPNMIFINQKGKIVYANKKCEEVTGYTRQELYSPDFNFLILIAPESRDLIKKNFDRHLKGEDIPPYEYTLINKAGERIEAINTSKLIQYAGMPTIIGIVTDITERKRAEQALREREETLTSIFRAAPIGIGLVSNRVLLQVNDKICEMLGYSRDELIGQNARILYPSDEDYEYVGREKYRQIHKYGTGTVETRWKCKDGRIVDIILSSTVFDSGDFSKGVTFTALDITDRKQAEQRLLEHRTQLKSLASELSLVEERERRRVAIELHDRIGQSLVISKMKLQTLRKSLSSSEYADTLKEVYDCLGQVIQDTRTLTFDLSYPILYEFGFKEAVAEWLEEQIRRKYGIETEFEDDGQPKLLDEDVRVLLFRDVRELLINVVKHAKASKVKVSVSRVDNDIQVCVEDNGVGFNADEIALLPTGDGGFGLFSIRERLEQIGGLLEIESEPDCGSRITMTAPIKYESITDRAQI